jgi:hypothetical protein
LAERPIAGIRVAQCAELRPDHALVGRSATEQSRFYEDEKACLAGDRTIFM